MTLFLSQSIFTPPERVSETFVAPLAERGPVERRAVDADAEVGGVLDRVEELGRVEHGLRRDAGVVQAAPTGLVRLDHGGLLAELGGPNGGVITAGTAPDHDYVIGIGHAFELI